MNLAKVLNVLLPVIIPALIRFLESDKFPEMLQNLIDGLKTLEGHLSEEKAS